MIITRLLIILLLNLALLPQYVFAENLVSYIDEINVYFSPRGGAQEAIVKSIDEAKKEIRVMAYSFTARPIADSLINAHKRGVDVIVILDKSQPKARGGKMQNLVESGITVYIDKAHAIAHNKVIIIDKYRTITGSYNFSKAAEERNAENVLILSGYKFADKYLQNFNKHLQHATKIHTISYDTR